MLEKQYVTRVEWKKHTQTHPLIAHGIWGKIKNYVPAFGYSQSEINAMWEGYSGTKGQVAWANVTGKPGTFTPSAHAATHQADGTDPLSNPLLLGASPVINWQSGNLILQTDEGTNTNTIVDIKGKGTGFGILRLYDENDAEYLQIQTTSGLGIIRTLGTSPGVLNLQWSTVQDIQCWSQITSGNPYFQIHGYQTGVGVKWGRQWVAADGIYNIQGQVGLKLNWPSYYADNSFLVANNKVYDSARWNGHTFPVKLDDWGEPDDNIDLNASISRHGLLKKLPDDYQKFLGGTGVWSRLVGSSGIAIYVLSKVSTTTRNSNNAEQYTTEPTSYVKLKETKLGEPTGSMKIWFEMRTETGGFMAYAKIYKNGVAVSAVVHSSDNVAYLSKSENIGACDDQDLIQIYGHGTSGERVFIRNMRFQYHRAITWFGDWEVITPIDTVLQTVFSMQNQDP